MHIFAYSFIYKPKLVAPNISSKAFTAFIILKSKHITSPFSDKFHNRLPSLDTWQSIDELVPLCNVSTNSLFFSEQKYKKLLKNTVQFQNVSFWR